MWTAKTLVLLNAIRRLSDALLHILLMIKNVGVLTSPSKHINMENVAAFLLLTSGEYQTS